jgi:hypothetical protein
MKSKLNKIKELLGMEVKFEQAMLIDGVTTVEAEEFAPDFSIGIVTEDTIVPMPVGEYTLESGQVVVVAQEGVIAEVKDAAAEPEAEVEVEAEAPTEAPETAAPKKVIESVSKETFFAAEKRIEALELQLAEMLKVKDEVKVELEAEPKKIVHNPEPKEIEQFKLSKKGNTRMNSVLSKIYK